MAVCGWVIAAMSAVAAKWEKMPYVVQMGQSGTLISYSSKNGSMNRRDVINNADVLGPLIQEVGFSAEIIMACMHKLLHSQKLS